MQFVGNEQKLFKNGSLLQIEFFEIGNFYSIVRFSNFKRVSLFIDNLIGVRETLSLRNPALIDYHHV